MSFLFGFAAGMNNSKRDSMMTYRVRNINKGIDETSERVVQTYGMKAIITDITKNMYKTYRDLTYDEMESDLEENSDNSSESNERIAEIKKNKKKDVMKSIKDSVIYGLFRNNVGTATRKSKDGTSHTFSIN